MAMDLPPINITPSKWPLRISVVAMCVSFLAIWQAHLGPLYLFVAVLLLGVILLNTYRLYRHEPVMQLSCIEGCWRLMMKGEFPDENEWVLVGDYSWHPWIISLKFSNSLSSRKRHVVLYPDSSDSEALRILRVYLLNAME